MSIKPTEKAFGPFDQFRANIEEAGITHLVKPLVKFSNDAIEDVPEPIDLIFIDGAHEYEAVLQDFQKLHSQSASWWRHGFS